MPKPTLPAAILAAAGLFATLPALAQNRDDPRIDQNTGAELANYPLPRHFDHLHMLLELDIPDMGKPFLTGAETLTVMPVGKTRETLELDAADAMMIESVTIAGKAQKFAHEGDVLTVDLASPLKLGQRADVRIVYSVEYPRADGTGLTWTAGNPKAAGETEKAAQIHSQGQPDYNHTWFACHDFPNERLTTELIVTVEDGYVVGSNGRLIDTRYAGNKDGKPRTRWHWLQDKPHCAYLVSMIVGKFAIAGLPPVEGEPAPKDAAGRPLPVYLYAPLGTEKTAQAAYGKTPAMVSCFAGLFDEAYPWDKYSQALVRRFRAGGMENTSATTMQSSSARAPAGSQDDVISHELAHQWFGDLMTCKGWEHAWLNEGWASFAEALWAEHESPKDKRRAYQSMIARFLATQRMLNHSSAPSSPPMVSNRYGDTMEPFTKANDIYSKGALVLHMLRQRLGDDVFFRGVRLYIQRNKFTCVETDDFRHALEEVSGESLDRFFTQWCLRPGLPRMDVALEWKPGSQGGAGEGEGELSVRVKQTQKIDAGNPAFAFRLPILIKPASGQPSYVYVDVDSREAEGSFKLPAKPADVVVDPNLTTASISAVKKPLAMWLRQLREEESVLAQVEAAEALGEFAEPEALAALGAAAMDSGMPEVVRREAGSAVARAYLGSAAEVVRAVLWPALVVREEGER